MYYRREEQIVNEAVAMLCTTGGKNRSSMKLLSCCVLQEGRTDRQRSCCHTVYYKREEQNVNEAVVMLCTTEGRNRLLMNLLSCSVLQEGPEEQTVTEITGHAVHYRREERTVTEAVVMLCATGGRNRPLLKLSSCCVLQEGGTDRY